MADIGDKLRSAREAKGLSLADIEKATKIQSRYLSAIEQDDFDKLPGDFYVRAFIRQYAQIVGLDGKELLSEYHQDVPKAEPEEYVEESLDNKSKKVAETTNNKKNLWKNYLPRIVIVLGIVVVVLIGYVFYAHSAANRQNPDNDVKVASQNEPVKKKKKIVKRNLVKFHRLSSNQYQITGLKKNRRLVVRAGDQAVTVTIAVNGITQWSQTLAAQQKHTMDISADTQNFVVTLSNDTGTSIFVGGKKVPYDDINSSVSLTFYLGKKIAQQNNNQANTQNSNSNSTSSTNTQTQQNNKQQNNSGQNSQNNQNNQDNSQSNQTGNSSQNNSNSGDQSNDNNKNNNGKR